MSTGIQDVMPASAYKYQNMPNTIKSKSKTVQFTPVNGSAFTSNSSNLIRVEIRSTGYLCGQESYLRFSITNNSNDAVSLDGQASSVIQRLRILANGVVLSDIQNYHQLSNFLINSQGSDDFQRVMGIVGGGVVSPANNNLVVGGDASNEIATTATKTYSIPLISGLLNSPRYLPLGLMTGGLVLELYLEPNFAVVFNAANAFAGALTYTVSAVSYIAKIIEIDDDNSENMIKNMMMTSGLQIKTDDWTCHQGNITNGAASATLTVPDRSSSIKNLISTFHHSAATNAISGIQAYKFNTTSYNYRVGSNVYPVQSVSVSNSNLTEGFSELMKCFNSGLYSLNTHTYLNNATFGNNTTYTTVGGFACAYDFENYADSEAFSGLDVATLGLPITFAVTLTAPVALNVNTFAHYDVVYTITPDGLINKIQ